MYLPNESQERNLNALLMQKRAREIAKTYAAKNKRRKKELLRAPVYRRTPR